MPNSYSLQVLLSDLVENDEGEGGSKVKGMEGDKQEINCMELSIHSMVGLDIPRTMKLRGIMERKEWWYSLTMGLVIILFP